MPFALPLAATAAAAAAPAAAAATASAGLSATLVSVASQAAVSMAINAAMSILSPKLGAAGRPVDWTLDPNGPIPFAFGRVGVAGSAIHKGTFGPDKMNYGAISVISGAGPIDGYESYTADDLLVTFDQNGKCVTPEWNGELFRVQSLGAQPSTWLPTPIGLKNNSVIPNWSSAHRASGKALSFYVMVENSKGTAFPNGEIKPRIVLRGVKCWDPRQDSTYPGGSGAQRLDNPATWVWSQNPIILALRWSLGLWEDPIGKGAPHVGQQVGGIGAKLSGIDLPAFVAAANICDANGWTAAAYPNTDDDKHQVLVAFLQAGGAIYSQRAGKISLIQRAAPKTSIATITADDVVGPIEYDTAASRIDRINTIQPSFWSPTHRWQITALPEVTTQAYRGVDGGKRSRGVTYPYVTDQRQAAQLAALELEHSREPMAGQVTLKPSLQRIRPGDVFNITEPGFLLDGLRCLCMSTEYDPAEAVVRVTFVSDTEGKYAYALGQTTVLPTPPTVVAGGNEVTPPLPTDWTVVVYPPSTDGTQLPGFLLEGLVSNAMATAVIVEWGSAADGPWTQAYSGPPTVTSIPIVGVQSGGTYWIAVRYQINNSFSERYVYGPYTAPTLSAGIDQAALDEIREDFDQLIGPIRDDLNELVNQTLSDAAAFQAAIAAEAQARAEALAAETAARAADLLAEREARGEDIAEVRGEISTVRTDLSAEVNARELQISAVEDSVAAAETRSRTYADERSAEAVSTFTTTTAFLNALSGTLTTARNYTDALRADASQTYATTTQLNNGLSTTLSQAKSYTDALESYATQTFITTAALNGANAATLSSARSYTDALRSDANQTFATNTALANGLAGTLSQATSYTDDKISTATLNFVTTATLNNTSANTLQQAKSYADGVVSTATLTFATKSYVDGGDATTLQGARSYTDALRSDSNLTFATQASLGTVSSNATLALNTAVGADGVARSLIGLETQVGGLITGIYSGNNGRIGNVRISADHFSIEKPGGGERTEYSAGSWRIYDSAGRKRVHLGLI